MEIALSLLVLTVILLVLGAISLLRRGGYRRQAILMFVLAAVMVVNIAIWTVPTSTGESLSQQAQTKQAPE